MSVPQWPELQSCVPCKTLLFLCSKFSGIFEFQREVFQTWPLPRGKLRLGKTGCPLNEPGSQKKIIITTVTTERCAVVFLLVSFATGV